MKKTTSDVQTEYCDKICRDFEESWQTKRITVEQFLDSQTFSESVRSDLTKRLILCEVELLRRAGETPQSIDYESRFPELESEVVSDLFSLPAPPIPPAKALTDKPVFPTPYKVGKQIGTGGVGTVWQIYDRRMERPLAGKVLHTKFQKQVSANQRLEREARLTGFLQHPGVPPIYDFGELVCGSKYLVMKLVEGETFAQRLSNQSTIGSLHESLAIFEQVVQTIAYAHAQGIVHRDIKPHNIMVGKFGEVQVMDWGMAKSFNSSCRQLEAKEFSNRNPPEVAAANETAVNSIDSSLRDVERNATMAGDVFGTPAYMPPEQAQGKVDQLGPTADVFSLGAVLFEILTGNRLHAETPLDELMGKAASGDLADSLLKLEQCKSDKTIKEICKTCLSADPKARPDDANAVADKLSSYLSEVQSKVRKLELTKTTTELQLVEERKRSKLTTTLAACIVGAMLMAIGALVWYQNDKANRQEEENVAQVQLLIDSLQLVEPEGVPLAVESLKQRSNHSLPLLRAKFRDPLLADAQRLRIALALAEQGHADGCELIIKQLSDWDDKESKNLFSALQKVPKKELFQLIDAELESAYELLSRTKPIDEFSPQTTSEQRKLHRTITRLCILGIYVGHENPAEKILVVRNKDATLRSALIDCFVHWDGPVQTLERMAMSAEDPEILSGLILTIAENISQDAYRILTNPLEAGTTIDTSNREFADFFEPPVVDKEQLKSAISPEFVAFLSQLYTDSKFLGCRNAAELLLTRCYFPLPDLASERTDEDRTLEVNEIGMTMRRIQGGEWEWRNRWPPANGFEDYSVRAPKRGFRSLGYYPPTHSTQITKPYLISDRLVSRGQFQQFLNEDETLTDSERNEYLSYILIRNSLSDVAQHGKPMACLSWYDMCRFCNWLSRKEGLTPYYKDTGKTVEHRSVTYIDWSVNEGANGYRATLFCRVAIGFSRWNNDLLPFRERPECLAPICLFQPQLPQGIPPRHGFSFAEPLGDV
jgi:serine/threonine protein kinase